MNFGLELVAQTTKVFPTALKLEEVLKASNISIDGKCCALATAFYPILETSGLSFDEQKRVMQPIIMMLAQDWFPEKFKK